MLVIKYGYECEDRHAHWEEGVREPGTEVICPSCGKKTTLLYMVSEYQYPEKN